MSTMDLKARWRIAVFASLACLVAIACISCQRSAGRRSTPLFTMRQTDSAHEGYRRTTLSSGSIVYENDYTEASLLSINTAPTQIVGELNDGGEGEKEYLYAIPGQDPQNYVVLAGPMYPLGIFRNTKTAPFAWRSARFQKMEFAAQEGPAAHKRTSDPALIEEVLEVLKGGTAGSKIPPHDAASPKGLTGLHMWSEQLPGMMFCPHIYFSADGQAYLGFWNPSSPEWSLAGARLSAWVKAR